jgi:hypothetical protein
MTYVSVFIGKINRDLMRKDTSIRERKMIILPSHDAPSGHSLLRDGKAIYANSILIWIYYKIILKLFWHKTT